MNPYRYVRMSTMNGETLLSLCAGIGKEFTDSKASSITAVEIAEQYVSKLRQNYPQHEIVQSDVVSYIGKLPDNSFDIVSCIDGIEHLSYADGLFLIPHMKRVCRKEVLVFTPDRFVKNEPHNAWGIEGADEYQIHVSGWTPEEMISYGFELVEKTPSTTQHGEKFNECMYSYKKDKE